MQLLIFNIYVQKKFHSDLDMRQQSAANPIRLILTFIQENDLTEFPPKNGEENE